MRATNLATTVGGLWKGECLELKIHLLCSLKDFQVELEKTSRRLQAELEKTCQYLIKEFIECFEAKAQGVERHIEQKLESMPNIHEL